MMRKKVCMLGAFAVGKTSLVRRFVHSMFSEKYKTTVGVKIDKKEIEVGGQLVTLLLWDLAGEDEFEKVRTSYLRGSAGCVFVVDGTRSNTLKEMLSLHQRAEQTLGSVPAVFVINKADLVSEWELDQQALDQLTDRGWKVFQTSAKTGDGVENSFQWLVQQMVV